MANVCLNCNRHLMSEMNFCPTCGQRSNTHRLTVKHILHDFFHAFTHADKSIIRLLKQLTLQPGVVAREYVEGKRQRYFNPFTFFLLCMAIFVIASTFFADNHDIIPDPNVLSKIKNDEARQFYIESISRGSKGRQFMSRNGNILGMIAIPFISLFSWGFFRKRGYNFAEHLAANVFFIGYANLCFTFIVNPLTKLTEGNRVHFFLLVVGLLLQVFYFAWGHFQFLKFKKKASYLKTFGVMFLAIACWAIVTTCGLFIYIYRQNFFSAVERMFGG